MALHIDPEREGKGKTGIYVRAQHNDGTWHAADIYDLDLSSLRNWLHSRGGDNLWAENVVEILLNHRREEK